MSTERVLTLRELNRATLARQLLLRRHRMPIVRAVERVAGLQGQLAPSPFIGPWSRLDGFGREALERALERQLILKAVLMRVTIHLVSATDYPTFLAAVHGGDASTLRPEGLALGDEVKDRVRALFADGPRTRAEVLA